MVLTSTQVRVIDEIYKEKGRYVYGPSLYKASYYEIKDISYNTVRYFRRSTFDFLVNNRLLIPTAEEKCYVINPKISFTVRSLVSATSHFADH